MDDPRPVQVTIWRQHGPQLAFVKGHPDQYGITREGYIVNQQPLTGISDIEYFLARAVLDLEIEDNIIPVLSFEISPP
jgi:hypothetical protein